jgi:hypothetical protein
MQSSTGDYFFSVACQFSSNPIEADPARANRRLNFVRRSLAPAVTLIS